MQSRLKCLYLGQAVAASWIAAETQVSRDVRDVHWAPSEPFITDLFRGHLRRIVEADSVKGVFARALQKDISAAFPGLDIDPRIASLANRLVATVNFHGNWHEGHVSAADLAVIVRRPMISRLRPDQLEIRRQYPRALLGQAKLGHTREGAENRFWGKLTKPQKHLIPKRAGCCGLLLYRLLDAEGKRLAPFRWQLCSGYRLRDMRAWLRRDSFPLEMSSAEVVKGISVGRIGTDDLSVIDEIASPSTGGSKSVDIRIDWPDSATPPPRLSVATRRPRSVHEVVNWHQR